MNDRYDWRARAEREIAMQDEQITRLRAELSRKRREHEGAAARGLVVGLILSAAFYGLVAVVWWLIVAAA